MVHEYIRKNDKPKIAPWDRLEIRLARGDHLLLIKIDLVRLKKILVASSLHHGDWMQDISYYPTDKIQMLQKRM